MIDRAKKICSEDLLETELNNIKEDLSNNGYPGYFINKYFKEKTKEMTLTAKKKPVYIRLPYKSEEIQNITAQRLKNAVKKTFYAAELRIIYETQKMLLPSVKDRTPVQDTSKCIYEFTCICGSKYIGRTERCLSTRIREHLPKWLLNSVDKTPKSSITKHLLDSEHSVDFNNSFKVINKQSNSQTIKVC